MSDNREFAASLLKDAARTILHDRPGVHGSAEDSFQMIAELWSVYLRHLRNVRGHDSLSGKDVAHMMSLLKKSRDVYGKINPDNYIDDLGYTALGGMLMMGGATMAVSARAGEADFSHEEAMRKMEEDFKQKHEEMRRKLKTPNPDWMVD